MSKKVGRPTKYNQAMQKQADRYVMEWMTIGDAIPSRVGLCCFLGISKRVSYEWADKYPEFMHTLEAVDALQECVAVNRGILGEFNSTITKLVLANHGYSDKVQTDHTSSDGSMTPKSVDKSLVEVLASKLVD